MIDLPTRARGESDEDAREATGQELNALLDEKAPWVCLNRQYNIYVVSDRVDLQARRDERIDAYAMSPN